MEREKWEQVKDIFDAALRRTADERERFVAENCGGDDDLRREVQSLLSSFDDASSFMQKPAVGEVAEVVVGLNQPRAAGRRFGHYEIVRQIGAGGMGEVYLARDVKLNRRVALKVLPENLSAETEANQRLVREAQAAATLDHPHICQIYEIAEAEDCSFIVMQYIEGETLAEKLGKEKLSVQTSLDLAIQITDALAEAHAHHVIHRDIKPANVIVNEKGQAKVLDFGLAKFIKIENEEETAKMLSKSGAIMGTVPYMSPEQVRGNKLDARTDIFSFGAMFYEMLRGRQPFARENNAETISAILNDEPSWTEIPPKLQLIVKKSLTKNRDGRYQTAGDLVRDLRELQHSGTIPIVTDSRFLDAETVALPNTSTKNAAPPATQQITDGRNFRLPILAGLISVIFLAGFGYGLYHLFNRNNSLADFRTLNLTRLTSNGKTKVAAISPDGKFLAYVMDDEGQNSLWLKNISAGSDVQILQPAENVSLGSVTFSPDGDYIYYAAKQTLYQLPILGGLPKKILQNFGLGPISFSPDGKQFTFIRYSPENEAAIIIADADGTNERTLASSKPPRAFSLSAVWSPDGKVIAAAAGGKGNNVAIIRVADGVISHIPTPPWVVIPQIAWRPDGNSLFVIATEGRSSISHQIWSLSYPGGEARNITNDLNNYQSLSLTANGRGLVAVRVEQIAHIWTMSGEETNQAKQLTRGIDRYDGIFGLNWLPDGKIVYETVPRDGNGEVWMIDAAGRNSRQLVDEAGSTGASPNGKYLVFQSDDGKGVGLFRLNLSDGEKRRLTTGADVWVTFSPDDKWIVFTRWGASEVALWKVAIDGGEAVKLTNFPGTPVAPTVSPDGKLIAFLWRESGRGQLPEIALIPFDGGAVIKTFNSPIQHSQVYGKNALQWTADGQAINFISQSDGISNLWRQPINGSPPVQVTNFESGRIFNFAYAPNGKHLALSRGTFDRDVILINNSE